MMRQWLKEEELLPDHHKVTAQARTFYIKVSRCPCTVDFCVMLRDFNKRNVALAFELN